MVVNTTYVNFNVLFEYGYAVGSGKAIWPLVEEGVSRDELVSTNIKSITTIGYSHFSNSTSIYKKMLKKSPWSRTSQFDLPDHLGKLPSREACGIFYIKSIQNNEPSLRITENLYDVKTEVISDDPNEVPFRHIGWYLTQIRKAYAVIIHLGNERMLNATLHFAKCALIAGISLALGRRLLILGENIKYEPIDYRDLIRGYKNAQEAEKITSEFLSKVMPEIEAYREFKEADIKEVILPKDSIIASADMGDFVAENEQTSLHNYFIETPEYNKALESKCTVFVGRKGAGKTANFLMIANRLEKPRHNLVCTIKPKEYQLNELAEFLKNELDPSKEGYLLESLWKFMIYSEMLATINEVILASDVALFEDIDRRIISFLEKGVR